MGAVVNAVLSSVNAFSASAVQISFCDLFFSKAVEGAATVLKILMKRQ